MKKQLLFIALFAFALNSCTPENMISLDEFTIDNNSLIDGEEVEILCGSSNTAQDGESFYTHVIVRSLTTGDTVNLLNSGELDVSRGRITNFISNDNAASKIMDNLENILNNIGETKNIEDLESKTSEYVYSDPYYIQLDWKKYPSIIGKVGVLIEDMIPDQSMDDVFNELSD